MDSASPEAIKLWKRRLKRSFRPYFNRLYKKLAASIILPSYQLYGQNNENLFSTNSARRTKTLRKKPQEDVRFRRYYDYGQPLHTAFPCATAIRKISCFRSKAQIRRLQTLYSPICRRVWLNLSKATLKLRLTSGLRTLKMLSRGLSTSSGSLRKKASLLYERRKDDIIA